MRQVSESATKDDDAQLQAIAKHVEALKPCFFIMAATAGMIYFMPGASVLIALVTSLYAAFRAPRLASAVGRSRNTAVFCSVSMFVPVLNLVVMLRLLHQGATFLRAHGWDGRFYIGPKPLTK